MDRWFLRIQSFIIRSTLLDQQLPEDLNGMFNSASVIHISIQFQQVDFCLDYSDSIPALTLVILFLLNDLQLLLLPATLYIYSGCH